LSYEIVACEVLLYHEFGFPLTVADLSMGIDKFFVTFLPEFAIARNLSILIYFKLSAGLTKDNFLISKGATGLNLRTNQD
jgi:hypothetical protein